jgi:integral membrane protein
MVTMEKVQAALKRYRVMAWITGVMLLVLTAEMVLKYLLQAAGVDETGAPNPVIGSWVAFLHGWIYVVYLVTVLDLWTKLRWRWGRLVTMVLAGVVPVMSFVMEHRVHRDAARAVVETAAT